MAEINHPGKIVNIQDHQITVQITSFSACHNCDARHGCGLMDCQNKLINVNVADPAEFQPGEIVNVSMDGRQGTLAIFYGYVLPLLLMLAVLLGTVSLGFSEFSAGISAIIILIPYYFGLFLVQKRLKRQFNFTITKLAE